jgi:hypothetical protein
MTVQLLFGTSVAFGFPRCNLATQLFGAAE